MTRKRSASPLVVVGSVAIDHVITPVAERAESVGGAATYFAMAASYLTPVQLVGVVGQDFPRATVDDLTARDIDLTGLQVIPGGKTFRWTGRYRPNMNERDTLDTQLGVFEGFDPALPPGYVNSEYLFLANIQPELQLRVARQMQRTRLVGLDTMNLWIDVARDALLAVMREVDVVMINEDEARQLTGEHNLVKAARALRRIGPKSLVIKRGEYGALLFHDEDVFSAPALPLEDVVDPTGAGDAFAGGFMGFMARGAEPHGENLRAAMIYGSVFASYCVQGFSYEKLANLDADKIQSRFELFRRLTDFSRADLT